VNTIFRFQPKLILLKTALLLIFASIAFVSHAQSPSEKEILFSRLTIGSSVPDKLLSLRSIVLFDKSLTQAELEEAQKMFQQTGIDAVAYFNVNRVLAGPDPNIAFTKYLVNRAVGFLVFFEKDKSYTLTFVPFNNTRELVNEAAPAWRESHASLAELLRNVYRACVYAQKKQNLLINDVPETEVELKVFNSRRFENFSNDAKSFKVAVPKWGNEKADAELEQILKEHFPARWELVDPTLDERELNNRGYITVLRYVHTEGAEARNILEYDPAQLAKSLTSIAYINGEADLKNIPANQVVYKFYLKHIEYGNIFLGKGWDADLTWQDALRNHLLGMREALKF
jgi:hypothetical protein